MNVKRSLFILSGLFLLGACGNEQEEPFEVAVIPSQSIGEMQEGLDLLEAELEAALGRVVKVEHYPNYNAVVEAINHSHIDLAYVGPVTYLIARNQSGAEAVLTQSINGSPYYHSYIKAHVDAPWDTLDELLADVGDVSFAFGSHSSTSGFTVPGYELMNQGVYRDENDHDFIDVRFTGSHDITAQALLSQDVDAGAIDSAIYHALVEEGSVDDSRLKTIWESEPLYQYPWIVPSDKDEDEIEAIQEAFLAIEEPEILRIFGGADAFVLADVANYEGIEDAARAVGLLDDEE
ncbi:phosphate/phosphite/phosphonate ABC transporter substrate-binding protein [Salisediminibacterium selenitireducens]|uniref:Phosphonate ABC transporter, periplasmic phosphonate-binding protein n=1 Tax=Bacillus selenitireducens (strain ATCC 700615 / DSM 15326 / MLS10) TaxID=439292 RepID=D6XWP7_BACIE|nr:phosphate/phosphite/phosphonate ABC transporter substrate-binding protein [Salisediminibacterium selenitireducens]ADH97889.1 phosphonate ABC transporter, periplasmic phosphonate-binding protein [[Bacillus] selenitireducens MLS10]